MAPGRHGGDLNKRRRSANYSEEDRKLLLNLVAERTTIIDNKKTDSASVRQKEDAWKIITYEFNVSSTPKREWQQLRTAYENIKHKAKRLKIVDRDEMCKTGAGGTAKPQSPAKPAKIFQHIPNSVPLRSECDSDAAYYGEILHQEPSTNVGGHSMNVEHSQQASETDVDVTIPDVEISESLDGMDEVPVAIPSCTSNTDGDNGSVPWTQKSHSKWSSVDMSDRAWNRMEDAARAKILCIERKIAYLDAKEKREIELHEQMMKSYTASEMYYKHMLNFNTH